MSKGQKRTLEPELTKAITKCISIGAGSIDDFSVNGKLVHKRVTWKKYCILDASYGGLICDNKLVHRLAPGDKWSAATMENDIVINGIDTTLLAGDVEALKKKTAEKDKVINI